MIVAKRLKKVYMLGEVRVWVLRGIDMTIDKGDMVAVMGPSGCGKTTLLNCLSGLDTPTSGEVILNGKNIAKLSDDDRTAFRAKNLGFVFQFYNLIPVLTALENVELPLLINGISPSRARAKAREMLKTVGLEDRCEHRPGQLSGGQRQKVAIARALATDPKIVFADEPTGNLDSDSAEEIMKLIRDLNRSRGTTMLVVTHNPAVARSARRVVRMINGRIVEDE